MGNNIYNKCLFLNEDSQFRHPLGNLEVVDFQIYNKLRDYFCIFSKEVYDILEKEYSEYYFSISLKALEHELENMKLEKHDPVNDKSFRQFVHINKTIELINFDSEENLEKTRGDLLNRSYDERKYINSENIYEDMIDKGIVDKLKDKLGLVEQGGNNSILYHNVSESISIHLPIHDNIISINFKCYIQKGDTL